jgi:hypothetical protein
VQDAVLADHVGFEIGKERKSVPLALAELPGILTRIGADANDLDASRVKVPEPPLETP